MDAPDRQQTLKDLLKAGTPTRIEEILDDAGIGLELSGLDQLAIREFWQNLHGDLDPAVLQERTYLAFNRLVGYARASIKERADR